VRGWALVDTNAQGGRIKGAGLGDRVDLIDTNAQGGRIGGRVWVIVWI
jgi:hypothetical protein